MNKADELVTGFISVWEVETNQVLNESQAKEYLERIALLVKWSVDQDRKKQAPP